MKLQCCLDALQHSAYTPAHGNATYILKTLPLAQCKLCHAMLPSPGATHAPHRSRVRTPSSHPIVASQDLHTHCMHKLQKLQYNRPQINEQQFTSVQNADVQQNGIVATALSEHMVWRCQPRPQRSSEDRREEHWFSSPKAVLDHVRCTRLIAVTRKRSWGRAGSPAPGPLPSTVGRRLHQTCTLSLLKWLSG